MLLPGRADYLQHQSPRSPTKSTRSLVMSEVCRQSRPRHRLNRQLSLGAKYFPAKILVSWVKRGSGARPGVTGFRDPNKEDPWRSPLPTPSNRHIINPLTQRCSAGLKFYQIRYKRQDILVYLFIKYSISRSKKYTNTNKNRIRLLSLAGPKHLE